MRFHLALAVLAALGLLTRSIEAADYNYPYRDPYQATATSAILGNNEATARVESNVLRVPGLPGRNKLPNLEGRGDSSLAFYRQNQAAPLLFILAGVGSNPYFGVGPYLASLFYRAGSHVVILPSPLNWNFALSASHSGAPGYAPADARDLYDVMQKTLTTLRDRYDVKPTAIRFLGVSLGALEGAYLSVLDADEGKIGIANYLLINPPIDLHYALKKTEEWSRLAQKFGPERSRDVVSKALAIVDSFSDETADDHGHDDKMKLAVKNYLQNTLKLPEPIILHEQPTIGRTLIEKFDYYAANSQLAFVILTPDDQVVGADKNDDEKRRARQNVILELGFFLGSLGRQSGRVFLLHKGPLELPSDLNGVVYVDIANGIEAAGEQIRKELEHVLG